MQTNLFFTILIFLIIDAILLNFYPKKPKETYMINLLDQSLTPEFAKGAVVATVG